MGYSKWEMKIKKTNIFYSVLLIILLLIVLVNAITTITDTKISTSNIEISNPNAKGGFTVSSDSNFHSELILNDTNTGESWAISHRDSIGNNALQFNFRNSTGTWLDSFMTVLKIGNIGIATTTPQNTLNVVGDLNVTGTSYLGGVIIESDNITTNNIISKDSNIIFLNNTGSEKARINGEGKAKLGIRANDPQYMLDMGGNTFVGIDGLFGHIIQHNGASSQFWSLATRNNGNFGIATSTTNPRPGGNIISSSNEKITITPSGNVGIGVTTPDTKLEVAGDIHIQNLEGSYTNGEAYVCVYNNGTIFAKDSACS